MNSMHVISMLFSFICMVCSSVMWNFLRQYRHLQVMSKFFAYLGFSFAWMFVIDASRVFMSRDDILVTVWGPFIFRTILAVGFADIMINCKCTNRSGTALGPHTSKDDHI